MRLVINFCLFRMFTIDKFFMANSFYVLEGLNSARYQIERWVQRWFLNFVMGSGSVQNIG